MKPGAKKNPARIRSGVLVVRLLLIATRDLSRCSVANKENREKVKRRREQARDAGKISGSDARHGQHARGSDWSAADVGGGGGAREHDSKVKRWLRACQHFFCRATTWPSARPKQGRQAGTAFARCIAIMHMGVARRRSNGADTRAVASTARLTCRCCRSSAASTRTPRPCWARRAVADRPGRRQAAAARTPASGHPPPSLAGSPASRGSSCPPGK